MWWTSSTVYVLVWVEKKQTERGRGRDGGIKAGEQRGEREERG